MTAAKTQKAEIVFKTILFLQIVIPAKSDMMALFAAGLTFHDIVALVYRLLVQLAVRLSSATAS